MSKMYLRVYSIARFGVASLPQRAFRKGHGPIDVPGRPLLVCEGDVGAFAQRMRRQSSGYHEVPGMHARWPGAPSEQGRLA